MLHHFICIYCEKDDEAEAEEERAEFQMCKRCWDNENAAENYEEFNWTAEK